MLTLEELKALLVYDEGTGQFRWHATGRGRKAGHVAGGFALGYVSIGINGRKYQAHRLAWFYVHGSWPTGEVDHINRDRSDNRIANLRVAQRQENGANCTISKRNTSGAKGVTWDKRGKKWVAQIMVGRRHKHLGYFDTVSDAAKAYDAAARRFFKEFASVNTEEAYHGV